MSPLGCSSPALLCTLYFLASAMISAVTAHYQQIHHNQSHLPLGVAANATERAVRGQSKTRKIDPIFRANQRGQSTHVMQRRAQVLRELSRGDLRGEEGRASMQKTRADVTTGWRRVATFLDATGDHTLAEAVHSFVARMSPVLTERDQVARELLTQARARTEGREPPTR
jgi:hypothetical protein